ncbi:MAG: hypothetical protein JWM85_3350 [Acidimicrobiaceae bacterium]|nr:hypothetical protein [Acidimicrobiaceae bacterium]
MALEKIFRRLGQSVQLQRAARAPSSGRTAQQAAVAWNFDRPARASRREAKSSAVGWPELLRLYSLS